MAFLAHDELEDRGDVHSDDIRSIERQLRISGHAVVCKRAGDVRQGRCRSCIRLLVGRAVQVVIGAEFGAHAVVEGGAWRRTAQRSVAIM